jgi:hypothetical protein
MDIAQGLNQNPEGPKDNLASERKPQIINLLFKNYAITFAMFVHLRFRN